MACSKTSGPEGGKSPAPEPEPTTWVGTWSGAPQLAEPGNLPPAPGVWGNTLRQFVHVSLGGKKLRLRFSNQYGYRPLTLNAAHVATPAGSGTVDPQTDQALTFSGAPSVTIPAGESVLTDEFDRDLAPLGDLAVSVFVGELNNDVTGHPGSRTTSYIAVGDVTTAAALPSPVTTEHWYFLSNLDVLASETSSAVAILGDSLTDGRGSTTNGNDRWPDVLAERLQADPRTAGVAVLNQGIGGNAVLSGGLGPTALDRFERDVLGQAAVRFFIVLEGVNDIGGAADASVADRLVEAYGGFIDRAHAADIRAYGVPILPFAGSQYDSADHEAARQRVNDWIRTSGRFDAVIDLDEVVRDPASPANLLAVYDSGDHLHLNAAGYRAMAEAIDLALFIR